MKISTLLLPLLPLALLAELEIRDASYSPVEGYEEATFTFGKKVRKVYLDDEILLTSEHVNDAFSSQTGDTYSVHIEFTDDGAQRFKEITKERIRKPLAILVDGKVLSVPTIMNVLSRNAQITGLSKQEAENLAERILNHNKPE